MKRSCRYGGVDSYYPSPDTQLDPLRETIVADEEGLLQDLQCQGWHQIRCRVCWHIIKQFKLCGASGHVNWRAMCGACVEVHGKPRGFSGKMKNVPDGKHEVPLERFR